MAAFLRENGVNAEAYYSRDGETGEVINRDIEERFKNNQIKAIVATIKLGMGYDKGDIAFVIHFQMPQNIVSYYQQIGRAGRNIPKAYTFLMGGKEDQDILNYFINTAFPTEEEMKFVSEIFKNKHYQQLISNNAILNGKSQADPFIIASAKIKSACIVTLDGFTPSGEIKEHAPKIAFISKCLEVDCCNFEQFMAREDWKF